MPMGVVDQFVSARLDGQHFRIGGGRFRAAYLPLTRGIAFGARLPDVRVLLVYGIQGLEDLTRQLIPVLAQSLKPTVSGIFFAPLPVTSGEQAIRAGIARRGSSARRKG